MKLIEVVNRTLKPLWLFSPFSSARVSARLEKAIWYARFVQWCRAHECPVSNWRPAIYEDLVREELRDDPVTYLEFGTYEGRSMRWWLGLSKSPQSRFIGFDTFEGLPEAWEGYQKGHFSTQTRLPDIQDPRCRFVKGLFQDSLPGFLKNPDSFAGGAGRRIVHVDADLFSSALFILIQMGPFLRPQDILIFDEFHVWMDEFRAFQFFLKVFPCEYRALFRSPDWSQTVLEITAV